MENESWFVLVGTALGAVIAAGVAWINSKREVRTGERLAQVELHEQRRQGITERTSNFLAASYHAVLSLRDLALAEVADKPLVEKRDVWPTVDRVNTALVAVQINDPEDLVEAVEAVDQALVILSRAARAETFTPESWRMRRDEVMGDLPQGAVDVARSQAVRLQ